MEKRYKITIEESAEEETLTSRSWEQGGENPTESGFGYTPQVKQIKVITRTVYSQNTDDLDLVEVIKAINGIT